MAEKKEKETEQETRLATEAQIKLANQLEEETQYPESVPNDVLRAQSRIVVSNYIHKLKEYKIRNNAIRSAGKLSKDFDKIGFGMVYKLVWRAMSETTLATKPGKQQFEDSVIAEYVVFKAAQQACREHVEGGGFR